MVSKIDLRIRFKLETGEIPTWPDRDSLSSKENFSYINTNGSLKSIYGKWLEDQLQQTPYDLKMQFKFDGFGWHTNNIDDNVYRTDYSIWLEEKLINKINLK